MICLVEPNVSPGNASSSLVSFNTRLRTANARCHCNRQKYIWLYILQISNVNVIAQHEAVSLVIRQNDDKLFQQLPNSWNEMKGLGSGYSIHWSCVKHVYMMMSSNGNIFRVTGPLCREFTGHRWIPRTKGQWRGALMFSLISAWINSWVNNREAGDLRCNRAHYDVSVLIS